MCWWGFPHWRRRHDRETFRSRRPHCSGNCVRCSHGIGRADCTTSRCARRGRRRRRFGREGAMELLPPLAEYLCRPLGLAHVALLPLHRTPRLRITAAALTLHCDPSRCPSGTGFFHDHFAVGHKRRQRAELSSPDAFKARIAADIDKWTKVVDSAGIEPNRSKYSHHLCISGRIRGILVCDCGPRATAGRGRCC